MKTLQKGLAVAVIQILIVLSVGGKLLYDRATKPQAETPPQFTECVSAGNGDSHPTDPRQMARRLQELIEQIQSQPNPAARTLLQQQR